MQHTRPRKEPTIPELLSLREAGRQLGRDYRWIKGAAESLGIVLIPSPPSLLMRREDFERLRDSLRPEPISA